MRLNSKRYLLAGITATLFVMSTDSASPAGAPQQSTVMVTRLFTGADNQTHAEEVHFKFDPRAGAFERWLAESETVKSDSLRFRRESPGYVNDWHPAAGRQYVITLSGKGEIEVAGGQKILLEPGRVMLAEDVTGKGHISRTLGAKDWISVHVFLPDR
jgi:quercetin dioxygenase-like cupin family protein